ncbi:MAG: hypothetical protein M1830_006425 [Pleopsidium flavum]|nr:MAG: hypothetical protein M1830_006425 [Pleopsidium flavum]
MDGMLTVIQDTLEGQIDFEGQKTAENITTAVLAGAGLVALMVGYIQQDIRLTLWIGLGGTALAFLMVVPPWPAYNELPEKWLPVGSGMAGAGIEVDGQKIN